MVLRDPILPAKAVAKRLDAALADVDRTAMVLEGFGADHVHAKLFPLHGSADLKESLVSIVRSLT